MIFVQPHLRVSKIEFDHPKRLLQHYLPEADIGKGQAYGRAARWKTDQRQACQRKPDYRISPVGLLWQSVFNGLAGHENVNDAERLRHDPAMHWIGGGKAPQGRAASPSQMGR
jgi:hypothetical protein